MFDSVSMTEAFARAKEQLANQSLYSSGLGMAGLSTALSGLASTTCSTDGTGYIVYPPDARLKIKQRTIVPEWNIELSFREELQAEVNQWLAI